MFFFDFLKLVLVANALDIPIAYLALEAWLQTFASRVGVGVGFFAVALMLSCLVALVSISYNALCTALSNPVRALKQE